MQLSLPHIDVPNKLIVMHQPLNSIQVYLTSDDLDDEDFPKVEEVESIEEALGALFDNNSESCGKDKSRATVKMVDEKTGVTAELRFWSTCGDIDASAMVVTLDPARLAQHLEEDARKRLDGLYKQIKKLKTRIEEEKTIVLAKIDAAQVIAYQHAAENLDKTRGDYDGDNKIIDREAA